ncbi:Allatostatin-A receptor [Chionoecetes opilio]|uniref:Allatostatin-A receptor n=1 Tax=Chionoecetes opilio TaxID=41210 RepID=A0A8J4YT77_CHIOP|nr:Allatostatin-A receptor [Chionoecetes opilio]
MEGDDNKLPMDEDNGIEPFLSFLPPYILCNTTNYTKLPLCNNDTKVVEEPEFEYALIVAIVVPIIFGIIVLVGLFGNTLVVIVIIANKQMRSTTNYLIFSLAMADLLFIVFCVPFTASDYILPSWPFGSVWCQAVQYLTYVTAYASVYTLLLLSFDRFLAVVHPIESMTKSMTSEYPRPCPYTHAHAPTPTPMPLHPHPIESMTSEYPRPCPYTHAHAPTPTPMPLHPHPIESMTIRTESNAFYAICFSWVLILTSCIPLYLCHGIKKQNFDGKVYIHCGFLDEDYNHMAFHIGFITTMYFVPLAVIVVLYLMILNRLWYGVVPGGSRSAESVRGKKRVTRMVVIVVVTFIVCWFPIQLVLLLKSLGLYEMTTLKIIMQIAAQVLAYINSCVNPILYAFLSDPFRKAFRKVIACGPQRRRMAINGRTDGEKSMESRPLNPRPSPQSVPMTFLSPCHHLSPSAHALRNPTTTSDATTTTSFTNGATREEGTAGNNIEAGGFMGHKPSNCSVGLGDTSCNSSLLCE